MPISETWDFNAPIVYFVDRSRDGASFTSRRVTAIQHGEQIFHMRHRSR